MMTFGGKEWRNSEDAQASGLGEREAELLQWGR